MPATVLIEGVPTVVEKTASGTIRVTSQARQINAMHGPGTGGACSYEVHPCQKHQFHWLNGKLPPGEQANEEDDPEKRPWWSLRAGERANLRE